MLYAHSYIQSIDIQYLEISHPPRLHLLLSSLFDLKVGREENETRTDTLRSLKELEERQNKLNKEIQKYCDSDPEVLAQMKENIKVRQHTHMHT